MAIHMYTEFSKVVHCVQESFDPCLQFLDAMLIIISIITQLLVTGSEAKVTDLS